MNHALICGEDLQSTIEASAIDGKCRIEPDKCTVLLYPEELKGVVTPEFEEK